MEINRILTVRKHRYFTLSHQTFWIFFIRFQFFFLRLSKNLDKFRITFQHLCYIAKQLFNSNIIIKKNHYLIKIKSIKKFESEISLSKKNQCLQKDIIIQVCMQKMFSLIKIRNFNLKRSQLFICFRNTKTRSKEARLRIARQSGDTDLFIILPQASGIPDLQRINQDKRDDYKSSKSADFHSQCRTCR